jgi:hypothetical protein
MAGPAPTGFESTKAPDVGPVHCSVWSFDSRPSPADIGEREDVSYFLS